jgi:hypothetical protein
MEQTIGYQNEKGEKWQPRSDRLRGNSLNAIDSDRRVQAWEIGYFGRLV